MRIKGSINRNATHHNRSVPARPVRLPAHMAVRYFFVFVLSIECKLEPTNVATSNPKIKKSRAEKLFDCDGGGISPLIVA